MTSAADSLLSFDVYLKRWNLVPDGDPFTTYSSRLLPVRQDGQAAMLKIAHEPDEKAGGVLLQWWDGDGAARVLDYDGEGLLLERAKGSQSLAEFVRNGRDDDASRILCDVIRRLHAPRNKALPDLIPLSVWFKDLEAAAAAHCGILVRSAAVAHELIASPRETGVLHGDIHHDNVLDFGARGWLAIDPKRLVGERGFDYANLFCNPECETPDALGGFFARRLEIVCETADMERRRLLQWILAWTGLSAAWFLGDGITPERDFRIAELAAAELDRLIA